MDVSIIIVNWNSKEYVRACLQSIAERTLRVEYECIIVDNASYDGCKEMLAEAFPAAKYIQSETNLGFARANNLGFSHSRGRNILYLNPDTELINNAIDEAVALLDADQGIGILGCRLLNSDLSIQTSCVQRLPSIMGETFDSEFLRKVFPRWSLWGNRILFEPAGTPADVEAVSGACMLMPRKAVEKVGGFSEEYFMYAEDLDLCYKIRRDGYRVCHAAAPVFLHHGGGATRSEKASTKSILLMKEANYMLSRKVHGLLYAFFFRALLAATALLRIAAISALRIIYYIARRPNRLKLAKWTAILLWATGLSRWPANTHKSLSLITRGSIRQQA